MVGALDLEPTALGVRPRRLPAWTKRQVPTADFDFVLRMTSGVRLAFTTAADAIELDVSVIMLDPAIADTGSAVFQLEVNGEIVAQRSVRSPQATLVGAPDLTVTREAPPATVRFAGLGTTAKRVELWLPHTCAVELVALRADAALRPTVDPRVRWVHHGSSISQGGEADVPTRTWPVQAARRAGVRVENLGFSGNATGDPFVARAIRDRPAEILSAEIGINLVNGDLMRRRSFEPLLHGFIDTVREGHPHTPLLLIGPIPCPAVETLPGPTVADPRRGTTVSAGDPRQLASGGLSLTVVREAIATVLAARSDDPALHYLDGRQLLRPEETGDLDDGLHPNARGLRRMGDRFARLALGPGGPLHLAR